ncbi:phage holin family protein [Kushneria phosphatilytica]|uniref:Uncharacterized protein n=1 Tax=Kushneria phosphatilytica TaxID=657387 RepID=A0A1S1NWR1_9GAMM|nr:phage holin family protein [Kushneria phosphatilytica]OHV10267.1 hypothetical protein BH688_09740 [Kushneria phosphatilytica]QEL11570.1 hypothetical protein FY550_10800 [Kushneria phosphatilytica]
MARQEGASGPAEKVISAGRQLFTSVITAGETRLRLAVVELEEERARLFSMLLLAGLALLLIGFGVGMLMLLVIVAFWEDHRLLAIGIASAVLLLTGALIALRVRSIAREPNLLRSTMNRFTEDRQYLERHHDVS